MPFIESPGQEEPKGSFTPEGQLDTSSFSLSRFGKETTGLVSGVADVAVGAIGMVPAGLAGLAAAPFTGLEGAGDVVKKTQELLTPSLALEKLGVPKEYLSGAKPQEMLGGINARQILEKIIEAPHEYLTKPVADKYFELTGSPLGAAIVQGGLDLPAYILAFKGAGALGKAGLEPTVKGRSLEQLREEKGYVPEKPAEIKSIDTTKLNQTELGFVPEGELELPNVRPPYRVLPEAERARLEQELNPPLEQRVTGQGELFTGEKPIYGPGELVSGRPVELGPASSVRGHPEPLETVLGKVSPGFREYGGRDIRQPVLGERESSYPGRGPEQGPLEYSTGKLTDLGTVGEARAKSLAEYRAELEAGKPIPFEILKEVSKPELSAWKGPGKFQRGAVEGIPFGKTAEKLAKKWEEKRVELVGLRNRLSKRIADGVGDIGWASKRVEEVQKEINSVVDKQNAALDALYKSEHEDYKGPGAWVEVNPISGKPINQLKEGKLVPFKGPGKYQTGAINIGKSITKKGVVQTIQDFKRFWTEDLRPLKDVMKSEHPDYTPDQLVDTVQKYHGDNVVKEFLSNLKQGEKRFASKLLIDKQFAILTQGKGPISTIVKWVVDKQSAINRDKKIRIENSTKIALDSWRKLERENPKALREMLTIALDNIGKEKLTRDSFKTEKQWQIFESLIKVSDEGWKNLNEARAKADPTGKILKPIDYINNHLPSVRKGDWWVNIKDASGRTVKSQAFTTWYGARYAYSKLKKGMGEEFSVQKPELRKLTQYDLSSMEAFEETIRGLPNDLVKQAVERRYAQIVGHRGYARTGLYRKGIAGALGSEEGAIGVKKMEQVIEADINRRESYISHLQIADMQKQMAEFFKGVWRKDEAGKPITISNQLSDKAPIATEWIEQYLNRAKGVDLDGMKFIRYGADLLTTSLGFSRGEVTHQLQKVSSMASLFFLTTPRNALVNSLQPLNAFAKLVEMNQLSDKIPNATHAYYDGYMDALGLRKNDPLIAEAKDWAIKHGYLDSAIVAIMESKLANFKTEGIKIAGELARVGLGKIERKAVRAPIFHSFEHALREEVPNKLQRFQMAGSLTDNYMVHYDRESSPLIYDQLGSVIGESSRGLKTYAHNTWGQFFEYVDKATDKRQVAPLAGFMAMQAAVGGLRGVFLVAEATAFIAAINVIFNSDWPNPEQLMLQADTYLRDKVSPTYKETYRHISDLALFGTPSVLLRRDISASVSAPSAPQLFNFVPIEFGYNAGKASWNWLRKYFAGTATDADAMKALVAVSPAAMRGWIEYFYSQEGGNIPNPNNKNMKGNYPVPTESAEQFQRFGLGFRSLDEAKINMIVRDTKQLLGRDMQQRIEALDAIADRVENKQEITPELMQQYIKEGGSFQTLMPALKQRIIDRQMDWETSQLRSKGLTPEKAHKLERMKELMDEDLRERINEERAKPGMKKMGTNLKERQAKEAERVEAIEETVTTTLRARVKLLFPNDIYKQNAYIKYQRAKEDTEVGKRDEFFREHLRRKIYEPNPKIRM